MIRVTLPPHLRKLARVDNEVQLDVAGDCAPAGEAQLEPVSDRVPVRGDGDEPPERLPVHEPPRLVDEVEAPVLLDARGRPKGFLAADTAGADPAGRLAGSEREGKLFV